MILTALVCSLLLGLLVVDRPARIPSSVIIGDGLSKSEAAALYTFSNKQLRGFYWRRSLADLKVGQFKRAWAGLKRGPERITALSKEPDGHFLVQATNGLGGLASIN
ncbi:MAG: hypothetical protein ACRD4E_01385, partial [Bryobacteraceae bacterium]